MAFRVQDLLFDLDKRSDFRPAEQKRNPTVDGARDRDGDGEEHPQDGRPARPVGGERRHDQRRDQQQHRGPEVHAAEELLSLGGLHVRVEAFYHGFVVGVLLQDQVAVEGPGPRRCRCRGGGTRLDALWQHIERARVREVVGNTTVQVRDPLGEPDAGIHGLQELRVDERVVQAARLIGLSLRPPGV